MKTFIDSGVLITGWRGQIAPRMKALTILSESNRQFISSPFVQLEVLPKAEYYKNQDELEFYAEFFQSVNHWVQDCDLITKEGLLISKRFGLNALDALHIAAAVIGSADEFVTAERITSPFSRVSLIKIIFIA